MGPPIPLSVLGVVFVVWLVGVLVVLAVLRGTDGRPPEDRPEREPDPNR